MIFFNFDLCFEDQLSEFFESKLECRIKTLNHAEILKKFVGNEPKGCDTVGIERALDDAARLLEGEMSQNY